MRYILVLLLAAPTATRAQEQQGSGSPYSAFGLGSLSGSSQVSLATMGVEGIALFDPFSVMRANPASYASLARTAFETGVSMGFLQYDDGQQQANGRRTDIMGLSLGVPFGRKPWGLALGINPVSQVGYTLRDSHPLPGGDGSVDFLYRGSGGLNRAFMGLGYRVWARRDSTKAPASLALGANFEYLFGSVETSRKAYYANAQGYYDNAVVNTLVMNAPLANVGLQFTTQLMPDSIRQRVFEERRRQAVRRDSIHGAKWVLEGRDPQGRSPRRVPKHRLKEGWRLRVGAAMESPLALSARADELAYLFVLSGRGVENILDTVRHVTGASGRISVPPQWSAGIAVYEGRWAFTVEHRRRDWGALTTDLEGLRLREQVGVSTTWAVGASLRPAGRASGAFHQNIVYRAGVRHTQDYLVVGGQALQEIGMAFGLSAPIWNSQTRSRFNLGMEIGEYGNTTNGLVRERFANLVIGLTFTPDLREPWMQKRRIE